MSNRYVWQQYTAPYSAVQESFPSSSTDNVGLTGFGNAITVTEGHRITVSTSGEISVRNGDIIVDVSNGNFADFKGVSGYYYEFEGASWMNSHYVIYCKRDGYMVGAQYVNGDYRVTIRASYFDNMVAEQEKGSLIGTVSNSAASTYPPRDYPSKSARIWPYSAPGMRGSGRASTSMYPLLGAALTI